MDLAILNYKIGARLHPNDNFFPTDLGILYFEQKRYLEAINEFRKANSLNPDDYTSHLFSSMANFKVGNTTEGNRLIRKFVWSCKNNCEYTLSRNDWF